MGKKKKSSRLINKGAVETDSMAGKKIKANISAWSEKSRRSYGCFEGYTYEDKTYKCRKCGVAEVYTAQEQKHALEVEKRYLWQARVLCRSCFPLWNQLKGEMKQFEARWETEKDALSNDLDFMTAWLSVFREYRSYDIGRSNWAMMRMLEKKIELSGSIQE